METRRQAPASVDDYISRYSTEVQAILRQIRRVVRAAAPDAREIISYQMPAYRGNGILIYFAAFKKHIGLYPPVRGDAKLAAAIAPYAGEKGNLQFPLDKPIPLDLIREIVVFRVRQDREKAVQSAKTRSTTAKKKKATKKA